MFKILECINNLEIYIAAYIDLLSKTRVLLEGCSGSSEIL